MDDAELLQEYTRDASREAFGELVRRYVDMVHASARRQVGSPHLADDVTQAVFLVLGRRAGTVGHPGRLAGWLLKTTHFAARNALRLDARRQYHERRAATMRSEIVAESDEPAWETYQATVDEAMAGLGETERSAVALRYLRGMSLREVGQATGLSEDAARKRVDRGISKLRAMVAKKVAAPSVAGLAVALAMRGAEAAPVGLADTVIATAGSGAAGTSGTIATAVTRMIVWTKLKVAAGITLAAVGTIGTGIAVESRTGSTPPAQGQMQPTATAGEYSVRGVPREGTYSLSGRTVTVRQALASAGADLAQSPAKDVDIKRRGSDQSEELLTSSVAELTGDRDFPLQANDIVTLRDPKPTDRSIEPGDHLRVSIGDLVGPNQIAGFNKVVDQEGRLHMPMVGAVKVASLSFAEAQRAITTAYRDANLIREADNEVVRQQTSGQWISHSPLRPNDWLLLRIWDLYAPTVESRVKVRVSPEGTIALPLVRPVKVGGMQDYEAELAIAKAYKTANLIQNAIVALELASDGSPPPKENDSAANGTLPLTMRLGAPSGPFAPSARTVRPELGATWKTLLEGWSKRPTATSIAMDYEITERYFEPRKEPGMIHGYVRISRKVSCARSGQKFSRRAESEAERSDGVVQRRAVATTFDGAIGRTRDSDRPRALFVESSAPGIVGLLGYSEAALPDEFMPGTDPAKLQQALPSGWLEILDVSQRELDAKPAIRLEYRSARSNGRCVAWYSPAQGYLQTKEQWYDADGNLRAEWRISDFQAVSDGQGASVLCRVAASRAEWSGGTETMQAELKVSRSSLRVNQSLPDSTFVLQPAAGERVINLDRKSPSR